MFNTTTRLKEAKKAKDEAKERAKEKELEFITIHKEETLKFYHFKCEQCGTEIPLNTTPIQRPTCEKCLSRYKVTITYPQPEHIGDNTLTSESIKPAKNELTEEIVQPILKITHVGYAYESRVNYPPENCTTRQLLARLEVNASLFQNVPDTGIEAFLLDLFELTKRGLKKQ